MNDRPVTDAVATDGADEFLAAWAVLAADLGLDPIEGRQLGLELAARHNETHRHYHTTEHIEAVLRHLEHLHVTTATARLAAFFHDVIYDSTRADNEERSAELFVETLGPRLADAGDAAGVVDDVAAIILATTRHELVNGAPRETAAFLDADLAVLGLPPERYDAYAGHIRAEYAHVADADFRTGRRAVLQGFLTRPTLYFTTAGQATWEVQARANLTREIAALA